MYFSMHIGVTIGFEETLFLSEEGAVVEVCVRILEGSLERNAVVEIASGGGTADGMYEKSSIRTSSIKSM